MAKQKKSKEKKPAKKAAVKKSAKKVVKKVASTGSATRTPAKPTSKKVAPKKAAKKGKKKPETLMCFLTTACVNYYGLSDSGYELNTLRNYRDTYLSSSAGGKKLIQDYYAISPEIVNRVEKDQDIKQVYAYIYDQVQLACSAIEKRNPLSAKKIYVHMVNTLVQRYHLD